MDMSSETGQGSTFWFTVRGRTSADAPAAPRSTDGDRCTGLRVLVVNEAEAGRRRLRELLESWQMTVSEALDAAERAARPRDRGAAPRTDRCRARGAADAGRERLRIRRRRQANAASCRRPALILMVRPGQPGDAERARQAGRGGVSHQTDSPVAAVRLPRDGHEPAAAPVAGRGTTRRS